MTLRRQFFISSSIAVLLLMAIASLSFAENPKPLCEIGINCFNGAQCCSNGYCQADCSADIKGIPTVAPINGCGSIGGSGAVGKNNCYARNSADQTHFIQGNWNCFYCDISASSATVNPAQQSGTCGDGVCQSSEGCATCAVDCAKPATINPVQACQSGSSCSGMNFGAGCPTGQHSVGAGVCDYSCFAGLNPLGTWTSHLEDCCVPDASLPTSSKSDSGSDVFYVMEKGDPSNYLPLQANISSGKSHDVTFLKKTTTSK